MFPHRRGYLLVDTCKLARPPDGSESSSKLELMSPRVSTEDLIDARDVAEILGLSHPSAVSVYQSRYTDMPRPVLDLGRGRPKLWLRPQIERWSLKVSSEGRTRINRRVHR